VNRIVNRLEQQMAQRDMIRAMIDDALARGLRVSYSLAKDEWSFERADVRSARLSGARK
jgi:hypothetical protein